LAILFLAEYQAVFRALEIAEKRNHPRLEIRSYNKNLVRTFVEWMPNWKQAGWKKTNGSTKIANVDLIKKIDELCSKIKCTFILADKNEDVMKPTKAHSLAKQGSLNEFSLVLFYSLFCVVVNKSVVC
jgi:ribonuclease HI